MQRSSLFGAGPDSRLTAPQLPNDPTQPGGSKLLHGLQSFLANCMRMQVVLCANTPEEHAELCQAGARCLYFNHNAMLDESIFCLPEGGAGKDVLLKALWKLPSMHTARLLCTRTNGKPTNPLMPLMSLLPARICHCF